MAFAIASMTGFTPAATMSVPACGVDVPIVSDMLDVLNENMVDDAAKSPLMSANWTAPTAPVEVAPPPVPFEAAVMSPFAFTVMFALVNDPTFELTVAKVDTLLADGTDTSPVMASRDATTAPVVGDMVSVPSELEIDVGIPVRLPPDPVVSRSVPVVAGSVIVALDDVFGYARVASPVPAPLIVGFRK